MVIRGGGNDDLSKPSTSGTATARADTPHITSSEEEEEELQAENGDYFSLDNLEIARVYLFSKAFKLITILFKSTPSLEDVLYNFKNGSVDYLIYENDSLNHYNIFQLKLNLLLEKVTDKGELQKSEFFICTPKYEFNTKLYESFHEYILNRVENSQHEGSNWTYVGVKELNMVFMNGAVDVRGGTNREITVPCYGSYIPWPANTPGESCIINIKTEKDCVQLCMIAHFLEGKNVLTPESYFEINEVRKLVNFPSDINTPISLDKFEHIENFTNTSIFLYAFYGQGKKKSLGLVRRGRGKTTDRSRWIYLLSLDNTHVVLINNIQEFIKLSRKSNKTKPKNKKYCEICCKLLEKSNYDLHFGMCYKMTGTSNVKLPKDDASFKFTAHKALQKAPFVCYYDTEAKLVGCNDGGRVSEHKILAYKYIIVDDKSHVIAKKIEVGGGDNLATRLIENISRDYKSALHERAKKWNTTPVLTDEEKEIFNACTQCMICNVKFGKKKRKIRHHDWCKPVVVSETGEVIESNYVATLCDCCNIVQTEKYYNLACFAHNSGRYDSKFILDGITNSHKIKGILTKSGENYISIKIANTFIDGIGNERSLTLDFKDSLNFQNASLEKLVETLAVENHEFNLFKCELQKDGYSLEVINMLLRKGVFPYEYITSELVLEENNLPPRESFHSKLKQSNISNEEYGFAQEVFRKAGCRNIKDYLELYLKTDVLLLAEVMEAFRLDCSRYYKLDPAHMFTTPGFAIQAALLHSKREIDLLRDISVITEFERNIRGGFTSVVQGKATFNNKYLKDFDPNDAISTGLFLDVNSLYPTVLQGKLPVGGFKELSEEEVKKFKVDEIDLDGDYCYALLIDFEIPDDVKEYTDDLPLGIHQEVITSDKLSDFTASMIDECDYKFINSPSLIASHDSQSNYLISLNLLRLYEGIGLKCTKIHRIFRFKQEALFKEFIEKNIELRKNSNSTSKKNLFKLMSNSIYGKLLFNVRKHCTQTKLITSQKEYMKHANDPFLIETIPIGADKLIMKFQEKNIDLKYPLYVGWFVLELSKYHMYNLYYNVLKKEYRENMSLVYMDTDSFLLSFKNVDVYEEISNGILSQCIDTSNFPPNHKLFSNENKGKLGLLKSETGDLPIAEAVCLAPKAYSMLLNDNTVKNAAKGVNRSEKNKLKHEIYQQIHDGTLKEIQSVCPTIRSIENNLYTLQTKKHALVKLDRKRYWLDRENSVAYGHPSLKETEHEKTNQILVTEIPNRHTYSQINEANLFKKTTKRKRDDTENEIPLNLTYKRVKNVINMFM